jgi:hypothetical protein
MDSNPMGSLWSIPEAAAQELAPAQKRMTLVIPVQQGHPFKLFADGTFVARGSLQAMIARMQNTIKTGHHFFVRHAGTLREAEVRRRTPEERAAGIRPVVAIRNFNGATP